MSEALGLDQKVRMIIIARDEIAKIKKEYEAKKARWEELRKLLEASLLEYLETNNLQNVKTNEGTFYKSVDFTASLEDPEAFIAYVQATGKLELLERRASVTAVKAFVEENNQLPPGAKLSSKVTCGANRVTGKEYAL